MTLDELDRLEKEATQGEWSEEFDGYKFLRPADASLVCALVNWYRSGGREMVRRQQEHEKIVRAAMIEDALLIRLQMNAVGKLWQIESVLDGERLSKGLLGKRMVGLSAEAKYEELCEAIDAARRTSGDERG